MKKHSLFSALWIISAVLLSCSVENDTPRGSGMIEATEAVISSEASGRLERLYFDEGQRIERGDTLALIDTTTVVLRLQQAEAARQSILAQIGKAGIQIRQAAADDSLARKEFDRIRHLMESGSANQQEFDRARNVRDQARLVYESAKVALRAAEADLARTEAEIDLLEAQYDDCRPVAPLTGLVVSSYIEEGELLAVGRPIIKIARLDTVWIKIYVPPSDLTRIKIGGRAEVDPEDRRESPLVGTVTWIAGEAEFTPKNVQTREARADLVYAVKVTVPNAEQELKIGMPVMVRIP